MTGDFTLMQHHFVVWVCIGGTAPPLSISWFPQAQTPEGALYPYFYLSSVILLRLLQPDSTSQFLINDYMPYRAGPLHKLSTDCAQIHNSPSYPHPTLSPPLKRPPPDHIHRLDDNLSYRFSTHTHLLICNPFCITFRDHQNRKVTIFMFGNKACNNKPSIGFTFRSGIIFTSDFI